MTKKALGKGLSALIGEADSEFESKNYNNNQQREDSELASNINPNTDNIVFIALTQINPGSYQPRKNFSEESLTNLCQSIKQSGVIQPILVEQTQPEQYNIIAGERRYRATKMAGLSTIPAIIKNFDASTKLQIALIENLQREDLTPVEEATAYQKLIDEFNYTHADIAQMIGKSRSHVSNMLRLLDLPEEVKDMVNNGSLSMGHARALINSSDPTKLAKRIITENLSVRQTEKIVANKTETGQSSTNVPSTNDTIPKPANKNVSYKVEKRYGVEDTDPDLKIIAERIEAHIGLKINISCNDNGGVVEIKFGNLAELDKIITILEK